MSEAPVRIQVLGPVRAWSAGEPVALRGASARTVVACLALRAGSVVGVDELTEALWGDEPPANATANLQSIISRLRRGLGAETIDTAAAGYRFPAGRVTTDLGDLEGLLAADGSTDPSTAADRLGDALDRWDGDALADVAPTPWFLPTRARLAELRFAARDRRHELLLSAGRVDDALVDLAGDAAGAPLRESTQLLLVEALHRKGRNAEALRAADRYRRALAEETGLDASPALSDLEKQVLADGSRAPTARPEPSRPMRWLPPDTPFVGREEASVTLEELTERHRLVTVVGTGGVGKSRLVMELVRRRDPGDVVVVLLAPVDPDAPVDAALAAALGLEAITESLTPAIAERIQGRSLLIVLDNCEHVLDSARDLVDELLRRVEDVTFVATSRQRLGLAEEQLLPLDPLPVPSEADPDAPAVRLFTDRVSRSAPQLDLTAADTPLVTDICRLLDGLPLALELAAARTHLLGLAELRARLVRGRLPETTGAKTMASTVSWSLELLGPEARTLFGEACCFPASFTISSLAAVSTIDDPTAALAELVDASLVMVEGDESGHRYRILVPIRQVGVDETPPAALDRYLDWVSSLAERAEQLFLDWRAPETQELLSEFRDDLRHALAVTTEQGDHEGGGRLARCLSFALPTFPDPELVGLILERSPENPDGLLARLELEWTVGRSDRTVEHAERLLDLLDDDDPRVPRALSSAGPAYSFLGEIDAMVDTARRLVHHPAAPESLVINGVGLWALGECYRGDLDAARRVLADHDDLLRRHTKAFIPFVRAEIAAATDPDAALLWLDRGARQARQDRDFLLARMIEIAQLALLVRSGERRQAAALARPLVDELLTAGLLPQTWMALRHVAALLAVDDPATALWILDSAAESPRATELVGEAVDEEVQLRRELATRLDGEGVRERRSPVTAGELWGGVEPALRRAELDRVTQPEGTR